MIEKRKVMTISKAMIMNIGITSVSSRLKRFCIYYYYSTHQPLSSMHLEYSVHKERSTTLSKMTRCRGINSSNMMKTPSFYPWWQPYNTFLAAHTVTGIEHRKIEPITKHLSHCKINQSSWWCLLRNLLRVDSCWASKRRVLWDISKFPSSGWPKVYQSVGGIGCRWSLSNNPATK